MNINTPNTTVPQVDLMRIVPRAQQVLQRHVDGDTALTALTMSFEPAAAKFITAYGQVKFLSLESARSNVDARQAMATLRTRMAVWVEIVDGSLQSISVSDYRTHDLVPDVILQRAQRLMAIVEAETTPPAYLELMRNDLGAAVEVAKAHWATAQQAMNDEQTGRAQARESATEVQQQLVTLRRILRKVLGNRHRDYRSLLVHASRDTDDQPSAVEVSQMNIVTDAPPTYEPFNEPDAIEAA